MTQVEALVSINQTVLRVRYPNSCNFNLLHPQIIKNTVDEVCEKLFFEATDNQKVLAVTELKQRMIVRAA